MSLQKEASELEKKIVCKIELYETTNNDEERLLLKEQVIKEHDYLGIIKEGFPNIILPQYEQIIAYRKTKGWG